MSDNKRPPETRDFYLRAMRLLDEAGLEFLVGGAYAFERYTGIARHTKDFDIFVHPRDVDRVLATLSASGCETELPFPHWLGKARCGDDFVDVIFSSGNGVAAVDDEWFRPQRLRRAFSQLHLRSTGRGGSPRLLAEIV